MATISGARTDRLEQNINADHAGGPTREKVQAYPGLNLIDYMAAAALQGLLAAGNHNGRTTQLAKDAYLIATAMVVEADHN